ncbi:hypothetical protein K493DRAFT_306491 [Basidiobolus meristosporus CBS 931.73]|uniref:Yeast cell wall synthesis Kre9/Knh1-like N-terminal domain-containing protein n=1 Tax=Basidiobolus meristosporus CBS 931.73 TaxID=1314790 RepID=A0A1Y1XS81_9FUNG|nr:hypothetical protein K493DRAFT_306491 [Basidiobolus meristosporus CBS 931.73]|eukprot:ORX88583.1 hypothetical protein K493DRAFT_306491 [Basidiobolus meristosporus CBS 931.73]
MIFCTLFLLISWVSFAFADIAITNPVEGTVWEPGKEIIIAWTTVAGANPDPEKIDITLMVGPATTMNVALMIGTGVDTKSGSLTWKVPSNLPPSSQYAIRAGDNNNVQYSHYFDVKEGGSTGSASAQPSNAKPSATAGSSRSSNVAMSTSGSLSAKSTLGSNSSTATQTSASKSPTVVLATSLSQPSKAGTAATSAPPGRPISMAMKDVPGSAIISILIIGALLIQ